MADKEILCTVKDISDAPVFIIYNNGTYRCAEWPASTPDSLWEIRDDRFFCFHHFGSMSYRWIDVSRGFGKDLLVEAIENALIERELLG